MLGRLSSKREQPIKIQHRPPSSEKPNVLLWLQSHWETALLALVGFAMAIMLAYLIWPPPQAVLTLTPVSPLQPSLIQTDKAMDKIPLAGDAHPVEGGDPSLNVGSDLQSNSIAEGHREDAKKKVRHARFTQHPKKPAHPPVLNLNQASIVQLQLLHGIGPKMAQRIIEYRHSHGPFSSPEQIMDVKGIGPKKFEKIKPYLKI